jgi:hypothetical protein
VQDLYGQFRTNVASTSWPRLVNYSHGVKIKGLTSIKGIPTYKCDGCGLAKARQNHHCQTREFQETFGERIALDRHDFRPENSAVAVIKALTYLFDHLQYQYGIRVKIIKCDNEYNEVKPEVNQWLTSCNIRTEPSAVHNTKSKWHCRMPRGGDQG